MGLNAALFYMAAAFALASALAVVFTKHTVHAALFFVAHLMALAVMYALLNAPVIAALQVMVYAGAVMILFVFAIMILDSNELEKLNPKGELKSLAWGGALGLALMAAFFGFANRFEISKSLAPAGKFEVDAMSLEHVKTLARVLYRDYFFTFELVGILLLVAVVGIMVMAKRRLE